MDDFDDLETNKKQHAELLENVLSLNRRPKFKKPTRTEPTLQVSEFNLVKSITGKQGTVHVNELTKALKKRSKHVEISKKIRSTERKAKILPKPLEKPQAQRIKRNLAYQNVKTKLDRWDAIVSKNRSAAHLPFPIPAKLKLYTTGETIKERDNANASEFPLTMQEVLDRRKEMAKMRAVQSYKEAKARRQSKIKSKKYHRVQRKEKIKNQIKEFEQLQKTDPEAALKKLEEIERVRVEERASLRHHSTGKWAQSKQVRAKYDKESRQVLAQQLSISRDLKQKLKSNEDSESEAEEPAPNNNTSVSVNSNNPWTNPLQVSNEVTEFMENYKKFWGTVKEPIASSAQNVLVPKSHENKVNIGQISDSEVRNIKPDTNVPKNKTTTPKLEQSKTDTDNLKVARTNTKKKIKTKTPKLERPAKNKSPQQIPLKAKKNQREPLKYLGTTDWSVGTLDSDSSDTNCKSVDIKEILEKYEEKLENQINTKYRDLKSKLSANKPTKLQPKKPKKVKSKTKKEVKPPKDKHTILDENFSQDNETVSQELQTLRTILNSSEKIIANTHSGTIKTVAVNLNTDIPDLFSLDDNEENTDQKGTITEAFEDDDIVEEFEKDKEAEINKDKPQDIDLTLPGWGSWAGVGIKPSKRKNKRFIIKFPKEYKRTDDSKKDVFINEKANKNIKKHMVSEVPFPFKNVKDYEASIRAPIGELFVPELAFKKMIKPAVTTKMGAIIEPMSDDILVD